MSNFRSHHDMGGLPAETVKPSEHDYAPWEKRIDALLVLLANRKPAPLMTVDELRGKRIGVGAIEVGGRLGVCVRRFLFVAGEARGEGFGLLGGEV